MTTQTVEFTADDAGCYVDGGQHTVDEGTEMVLELAEGYGWYREQRWDLAGLRKREAVEYLNSLQWWDLAGLRKREAVEYLNSLPMPADYAWAWNDGDFGFYHSCIDDDGPMGSNRTTTCEFCIDA